MQLICYFLNKLTSVVRGVVATRTCVLVGPSYAGPALSDPMSSPHEQARISQNPWKLVGVSICLGGEAVAIKEVQPRVTLQSDCTPPGGTPLQSDRVCQN